MKRLFCAWLLLLVCLGSLFGCAQTTEQEKTPASGEETQTAAPEESEGDSAGKDTQNQAGASETTPAQGETGSAQNSGETGTSQNSSGDTMSQAPASGETQPPVQTTPSAPAVHTHSFQVLSKTAPGCTQEGVTVWQCACGAQKTETAAATGHNPGVWQITLAATTSSAGTQERACQNSGCTYRETQSIPALTSSVPALYLEVLNLVNAERAKAGKSALSYCSDAQAAADLRARETVSSFDEFGHTRPDGRDFWTAFDDAGCTTAICFAENLAKNYYSAQEVVNAWMNSPAHRQNILSQYSDPSVPNAEGMVVSCIDGYWVQLFVVY